MKKEKYQPEPNEYKWTAIDLMIHAFDLRNKELTDNAKNFYKDKLFNRPVTLSEKYDGTNVGVDEHGVLYGRN